MRYAAIDIGSNALRLLLCNVVEESGETHFKKVDLVRMPLRLGEDSFLQGKISEQKITKFVKTMTAYKHLIDVFEPVDFRACATSAMRDASNKEEVIQRVKKECGLKIEIIPGREEADLIFSNHVEEHLDKNKSYLYIDVGGGSTELTLFSEGRCLVSQSFDIGTIRWMNEQVPKEKWWEFKDWVRLITTGHQPVTAIGSGGNINKIFKLLKRKDGQPLPFDKLKEIYSEMKMHTIEDRMEIWNLNPDRADVIVPAAKIFLSIMKAAQINEIIVPQIGLADGIVADGIVHQLHEKQKQKNFQNA
jgi:exopolyphosphatase/guanosine-5'-triphosphate,3'-diphosphate pyrophosphatase